jgi:O-methyltransferase
MRLLGVDESRLVIHKGWFKDTFPVADVPAVALLHIDCDFYEATRDCLERWFPLMAQGGIVQVDDYEDFLGSRTAVDELIAARPFIELRQWGTSGKAYYFECRAETAGSEARRTPSWHV